MLLTVVNDDVYKIGNLYVFNNHIYFEDSACKGGSPFLQELSKHLEESAHNSDVDSMLEKVINLHALYKIPYTLNLRIYSNCKFFLL